MGEGKSRKRRIVKAACVVFSIPVVLAIAVAIYFPGRQLGMAWTLATGLGVETLQSQVDALEEKTIEGGEFTDSDKAFLHNLYTCFAKGGRLTWVLRQSSEMMRRYLSCSGEELETAPRIFVNSRPVVEEMDSLRERALSGIKSATGDSVRIVGDEFYMGDPAFFESMVGLYFGHLEVSAKKSGDGNVLLNWRAEVPWEWPRYDSLHEKYGKYHAQTFPLPNVRSFLFGEDYCLWMDDGLGGHLEELGLAKSFLVYSEWEETVAVK